MKKKLLSFTLFFLMANQLFAGGAICPLGYPRSGNNWLNFCLHKMLSSPDKRGVIRPNPNLKFFAHNPYETGIDKLEKSQNYLIVILRNYRESMMRNNMNLENLVKNQLIFENKVFLGQEPEFEKRIYSYPAVLKCYDEWDPSKRLLIYYEDLMEYPEATLKAVIRFLGKDEALVDNFMKNYLLYRKESLENYADTQSISKGLLYHTSLMSQEAISHFDNFMKTNYPDYWEKYLSRYEYQP